MTEQYGRASAAQKESWHLAQYALWRHRVTLMARFNQLVGAPSYAAAVVQDEFVRGRMEPDEMLNYARACREIIFSIEITSTPDPDPFS